MHTEDKIKNILATAECLIDMPTIEKALDKMAQEITDKLKDTNPIVISVMIGALVTTGHLLTRLSFPLEVDYIHATRYQGSTRGGDLHWLVEPRQSLKNRTILVVDDIMDGGLTLSSIIDYCKQAGAKKVYTAVLVNKRRKRETNVEFEPDFNGLYIDNKFIFGFGLDYNEYFRNIAGIYAVSKEHE